MIIEVPVAQLKKLRKLEGTVSIKRETQHFCGKFPKVEVYKISVLQKLQQCTDQNEYFKENGNFVLASFLFSRKKNSKKCKNFSWATLFWLIMVSCSLGLLITQVFILASEYLSKPTVSDVRLHMFWRIENTTFILSGIISN